MAKIAHEGDIEIRRRYQALKNELAKINADKNRSGVVLGNRPENEVISDKEEMEKQYPFLLPPPPPPQS